MGTYQEELQRLIGEGMPYRAAQKEASRVSKLANESKNDSEPVKENKIDEPTPEKNAKPVSDKVSKVIALLKKERVKDMNTLKNLMNSNIGFGKYKIVLAGKEGANMVFKIEVGKKEIATVKMM